MLGEIEEADRIYAKPPDDVDQASLFWLMKMRATVWRRDAAALAKMAADVEHAPAFASLPMVQGILSIVVSKEVSPEGWKALGTRASNEGSTRRLRSYWWQLRAELGAYLDPPDVLDDIHSSVDMGLFDVVWLDHCPILAPKRTAARF